MKTEVTFKTLYVEPIKRDGRYIQFHNERGERCHLRPEGKFTKFTDMDSSMLEWDNRTSESNLLLCLPSRQEILSTILERLYPGMQIIPSPFA